MRGFVEGPTPGYASLHPGYVAGTSPAMTTEMRSA